MGFSEQGGLAGGTGRQDGVLCMATNGSLARRTIVEAWRRVPIGTPLSQGVRINLVAGSYPQSDVPLYRERRHGTFAAPVILRAADGAGTARLPTLNIFDCHHFSLDGV